MTNFLLSICMPMFRDDHACRRAYFSALLPVLERSDMELVICDNNLEADREFIRSTTNSRINYIANSRNIGAGQNFRKVYAHAKGSYCLMLGDDDYLEPSFFETYLAALEQGLFENASVIASAPLFFDTPGILCPNPRVPQNKSQLATGTASERIKFYSEWLNNTPGNPLYYSILNKDIVDFDYHCHFSLNCPGYTSFIDVPFAEGLALSHPVTLLPRSYYVYNMQNWGASGWQAREILKYRSHLKPNINTSLTDHQVFTVRYLNKCVIALSYFLGLGKRYSESMATFDFDTYLEGVHTCLKYRYLPKGINGIDILSLKPSYDSLFALLEKLTLSLSPYLADSDAFRLFVLEAPMRAQSLVFGSAFDCDE